MSNDQNFDPEYNFGGIVGGKYGLGFVGFNYEYRVSFLDSAQQFTYLEQVRVSASLFGVRVRITADQEEVAYDFGFGGTIGIGSGASAFAGIRFSGDGMSLIGSGSAVFAPNVVGPVGVGGFGSVSVAVNPPSSNSFGNFGPPRDPNAVPYRNDDSRVLTGQGWTTVGALRESNARRSFATRVAWGEFPEDLMKLPTYQNLSTYGPSLPDNTPSPTSLDVNGDGYYDAFDRLQVRAGKRLAEQQAAERAAARFEANDNSGAASSGFSGGYSVGDMGSSSSSSSSSSNSNSTSSYRSNSSSDSSSNSSSSVDFYAWNKSQAKTSVQASRSTGVKSKQASATKVSKKSIGSVGSKTVSKTKSSWTPKVKTSSSSGGHQVGDMGSSTSFTSRSSGTGFIAPIVLDLDGDGIELIAIINSRVQRDMDGDGYLETTAWVSADDGILAIDLAADGTAGADGLARAGDNYGESANTGCACS